MMWSEKYRIRHIQDFFGNEKSRVIVVKWLKSWIKGTKPLMIVGPPGTGKTSFVTSVTKYLNYDIIELNASDIRNKGNLETIIRPILYNASIFGKKILLFLDEVDGISGRDDSGGLSFLVTILKNSSIPIIMAANSRNMKIKELLKNSKLVEFLPLTPFSSFLLLQFILMTEDRSMDLNAKLDIVEKSNGDARTLLNLAQLHLEGNYKSSLDSSVTFSIDDCINNFFSATSISEAKKILIRSDIKYISPAYGITPEDRIKDIVYAIFSSVVTHHKGMSIRDMSKILEGLSQIDLFINRIYRNRNWGLLKYANDILILNLFDVTRGLGIRYSQYNVPFPLMGSIFIRGNSLKVIRNVLSKVFHTSSSGIGMFYLFYIIYILKNQKIEFLFFNTDDDLKLNEILLKEKEKLKFLK